METSKDLQAQLTEVETALPGAEQALLAATEPSAQTGAAAILARLELSARKLRGALSEALGREVAERAERERAEREAAHKAKVDDLQRRAADHVANWTRWNEEMATLIARWGELQPQIHQMALHEVLLFQEAERLGVKLNPEPPGRLLPAVSEVASHGLPWR